MDQGMFSFRTALAIVMIGLALSSHPSIASGAESQGWSVRFWDPRLYLLSLATVRILDVSQFAVKEGSRYSVLKYSEWKLDQALNDELSPEQASRVKQKVWPVYRACVEKTASLEEVNMCAGDLTIASAVVGVEESISGDPRISAIITSKEVRQKLAFEQKKDFQICATTQWQLALHTDDGQIDLSPCKDLIENRVTKIVLTEALQAAAKARLGSSDWSASEYGERSVKALHSCWDDKSSRQQRNQCSRSAVILLSTLVAAKQLDRQFKAYGIEGNRDDRDGMAKRFETCLKRELPEDITGNDRNPKLERCSGALRREAGVLIAGARLSQAFSKYLNRTEVQSLLNRLVSHEFPNCLGFQPSNDQLERCVVKLKQSAGMAVGQYIVPRSVQAYLNQIDRSKRPLLPAERTSVAAFLKQNQDDLIQCLNRTMRTDQPELADQQLNKCLKTSVRGITLNMGEMRLKRETLERYKGREAEWRGIRDEFLRGLNACLGVADRKQDSLEGFVQEIDGCAVSSSVAVTGRVGRDLVFAASKENFKDSNKYRFDAEREELSQKALTPFDSCLSKAESDYKSAVVECKPGQEREVCMRTAETSSSQATDACIDQVQRQATLTIAVGVGNSQLMDQLGRMDCAETRGVEAELRSCVTRAQGGDQLGDSLDACLKDYSMELASVVANIKVHAVFADGFGRKAYEQSVPEIQKILSEYAGCLDSIRDLRMGKSFKDGINKCAERLLDGARVLVGARIEEWFGPAEQGPGSRAKEILAKTMPCLDSLMPPSPVQDVSANIDAEGTLEALVKMLKSYIDYDASKADQDVAMVIEQLQNDLSSVGPQEARERLFDLLVKNGVLEQLTKGLIAQSVKDEMKALPAEDRLPEYVRAKLSDPQTIDAVFGRVDGKQIINEVAETILRPVLVQGRALSEPEVAKAQGKIRERIGVLLASSPEFGELLVGASVQKKLDALGPTSRFFVKLLFGRNSLSWKNLRETKKGTEAEAYIRDHIIKPKISGEALSANEEKRRIKKAQSLIRNAIVNPKIEDKSKEPLAPFGDSVSG